MVSAKQDFQSDAAGLPLLALADIRSYSVDVRFCGQYGLRHAARAYWISVHALVLAAAAILVVNGIVAIEDRHGIAVVSLERT
jgi:hypothetical protein